MLLVHSATINRLFKNQIISGLSTTYKKPLKADDQGAQCNT